MTYIPDFYHCDKINSWAVLKKSVPFVIFKATQGVTFIDPKLGEYIKNCEKYEIPYWLYIFLNNGNELAQVKYALKNCEPKVGEYFQGYCIDIEKGNAQASVKTALEYLKTKSTKMMLYTGYADFRRYESLIKNRGKSCAWWEARYGKNDGKLNENYPPHDGVDLFQFTSKGVCPGITNKCDLSAIIGFMPEPFFTGAPQLIKPTSVTAQDILNVAEKWLGLKESDGSYIVILDTYNEYEPLARGYKVTTKDSWCATFVSAVFIKANAVDLLGGTECSVQRFIDIFKAKGIWNEDGKVTPEEAWIICYNWDDKTQPNDGWADHIGIVKEVKDGYIYVIEGNYQDAVKIRKIKVGDGRIRGYAMPQYAVLSPSEPISGDLKPKPIKYTGRYPKLPERGFYKRGDGIDTLTDSKTQIKYLQKLVNWIAGENLAVDGKYGPKTEAAVKKAQKILGVTVDGEFGEKTLAAAKKYRR